MLDNARLVGEIVWTYPKVRLLLRRADLPTTIARLRADAEPSATPPVGAVATGRRLGRAVARTLGFLPLDSRCLSQSLVLCALLARRGIVGTLVIGVRPGDNFGAHAWVELGGKPLLMPGRNEYPRLVEL